MNPLNIEKQFSDLQVQVLRKSLVWKAWVKFMKIENTSDWVDCIEILLRQLKEEILPKRVLLLRAKLIEEELRQKVQDYYVDMYFTADLNTFIKIGADDAYTKDYSEKNVYTKDEIKEKKLQAGVVSKPVVFPSNYDT